MLALLSVVSLPPLTREETARRRGGSGLSKSEIGLNELVREVFGRKVNIKDFRVPGCEHDAAVVLLRKGAVPLRAIYASWG